MKAEHGKARGISPQFLFEEAIYQNDFHDAVAEQVESIHRLPAAHSCARRFFV